MRGTYKGYSYGVYYFNVIVCFMLLPMLFALFKGTAAVVCAVLGIAGGVGLMLFASQIPCRFRADETGFTITEMGVENRFEYDNVRSIEFRLVYARYGSMIKLTVKDDMGETNFYEPCTAETMNSLLHDPDGKRPQLVRLCEYVQSVKGAGA